MAVDLTRVMRRTGARGDVSGLRRLTGGANMETWRFTCGANDFVLRRAPSAEWIAQRAINLSTEASVIRHAQRHGVRAPEIVTELSDDDGLGIGFIMRALPGSADPKIILEGGGAALIVDIAEALAQIHALDTAPVAALPLLDPAEGVARLVEQFESFGGDRPIIALGLAWLRAHVPEPATPRLLHGDLRIGNVLADAARLTGVLDWELAHLGDPHEDLAFGCMTVWRFSAVDKPAFGLSDLDTFFAAYEKAGGAAVDRQRFRFWLIYRTVWWALGCLNMGRSWRSGADRSLERVVVARRAAEQELDLLLLLDDAEARAPVSPPLAQPEPAGEPTADEILCAVSEWLAGAVKPKLEGRDRFDLAVARNAISIVRRELQLQPQAHDRALAQNILAGRIDLTTPGLAARLRASALTKAASDMPKYPSIPIARARWQSE